MGRFTATIPSPGAPLPITEISHLIDICNTHDGLRMRIGLEMLRERSEGEINDFLYYVDGQLVGYLEADSWGKKEKELTGMVRPDFRRQGIFTALFTAAREELQQRGAQVEEHIPNDEWQVGVRCLSAGDVHQVCTSIVAHVDAPAGSSSAWM